MVWNTKSGFLYVLIVCFGFSGALSAQNRVAFVTSATGNANLSSWPEAGKGLMGADAADSICVSLATSAKLGNPNIFKAWLSTSVDDAYCRVHNLTGEKGSNCGEVELPVAAGPWVRTDGVAAGAFIDQLLSPGNKIYVPLLTDETGSVVANDQRAYTSTDADGVERTDTCSDWTDGVSGFGRSTPLHANDWRSNGSSACSSTDVHLICLETVAGPALDLPLPTGNIAFLADASGTGDLSSWPDAELGTSGMEAGDSICNARAAASGLSALINTGVIPRFLKSGHACVS